MTILIVGGGHFGNIAIEFAKRNKLTAILVDKDPNCIAGTLTDKKFDSFNDFQKNVNNFNKNTIYFIKDDITIINDLLNSLEIEYIIPVVPIHLIASMINNFLKLESISLIPDMKNTSNFIQKFDNNLILNKNIEQGTILLSHAKINETCPDNCVGPANFCPYFKREKSITITRFLKEFFKTNHYINICKNDIIKITILIESYQLRPGLGGLRGSEVKKILNILNQQLASIKFEKCEIVIATTCNCHGVLNFLKKN